jgi:hypothetical protein
MSTDHATLKSNISQANLDLVRRMQWLEEFPRGAMLVTYLYRILLSVEADHTLNELLHTIFRQTLKPILKMLSDFISSG